MGCIKVIVRHLVGLLAFFTWLTGSVVIAVCLWIVATSSGFNNLIEGKLPVTYFTLGFSGLFFLNGLLGWTGASKKNNILLKLFLILTFLLIVAEIGLILAICIFKASSGQLIDQTWQELNNKSRHLIQDQLACCGLNGPADYNYEIGQDLDASCYSVMLDKVDNQQRNSSSGSEAGGGGGGFTIGENSTFSSTRFGTNSRTPNVIGCRARISDWFFDNRLLILASIGCLLLYQLLSMLLTSTAISFKRRMRRHDSLEELDSGSSSDRQLSYNHPHHHNHLGASYM